MALRTCDVSGAGLMPGPVKSIRSCPVTVSNNRIMSTELERKVAELLQNPKNMGELEAADAVGSGGNAGGGEMLRMGIKFNQQTGKRGIARAPSQSFGKNRHCRGQSRYRT